MDIFDIYGYFWISVTATDGNWIGATGFSPLETGRLVDFPRRSAVNFFGGDWETEI